MTLNLAEAYNRNVKTGHKIALGDMEFVFSTGKSDVTFPDIMMRSSDARRQMGPLVAGQVQLEFLATLLTRDNCEDVSSVVPVGACEAGRSIYGENKIESDRRAYSQLLDELKADITNFEGKLHDDPRIHNAMLVDYLINSRVKYTPDEEQYGDDDLWAHPNMTASSMKGDCEDYAILKLQLMKDLGVVRHGEAFVTYMDMKDGDAHANLIVIGEDGQLYVFENYEGSEDSPLDVYATPLSEYMEESEVEFLNSLYDGENAYTNVALLDKSYEDASPPVYQHDNGMKP